jgi:hypothetical protein
MPPEALLLEKAATNTGENVILDEFRARVLAEFTKIPDYLRRGFLREIDIDGS